MKEKRQTQKSPDATASEGSEIEGSSCQVVALGRTGQLSPTTIPPAGTVPLAGVSSLRQSNIEQRPAALAQRILISKVGMLMFFLDLGYRQFGSGAKYSFELRRHLIVPIA